MLQSGGFKSLHQVALSPLALKARFSLCDYLSISEGIAFNLSYMPVSYVPTVEFTLLAQFHRRKN